MKWRLVFTLSSQRINEADISKELIWWDMPNGKWNWKRVKKSSQRIRKSNFKYPTNKIIFPFFSTCEHVQHWKMLENEIRFTAISWAKHIDDKNLHLRPLSVKTNSAQMHMSAASHVGRNSSAFVARSSVQMYLTAVHLNWNELKSIPTDHPSKYESPLEIEKFCTWNRMFLAFFLCFMLSII